MTFRPKHQIWLNIDWLFPFISSPSGVAHSSGKHSHQIHIERKSHLHEENHVWKVVVTVGSRRIAWFKAGCLDPSHVLQTRSLVHVKSQYLWITVNAFILSCILHNLAGFFFYGTPGSHKINYIAYIQLCWIEFAHSEIR